jgi:hypothetical protein
MSTPLVFNPMPPFSARINQYTAPIGRVPIAKSPRARFAAWPPRIRGGADLGFRLWDTGHRRQPVPAQE